MKYRLLAAAAALAFYVPAAAQEASPPPSPSEIAAAASADDWIAIPASDLLIMDLAPAAKGKKAPPRRVVILLMPAPFSQGWIGNIRKLAAVHWWDGTSINRVQDNYVVQWGDATEKKPLPEGLSVVPESQYVSREPEDAFLPLFQVNDPYAGAITLYKGWPLGFGPVDPDDFNKGEIYWPLHCYAMVGVGRNMSPDTGSGAELYTVIGQAPRHLDRNIAVVGRVIAGIEHLSSLPRGTGALGFYETAEERVPIKSIRLAADLPPADQPKFEYLSTASDSFAKYADARENRRDPFFIRPAGGADICNIPIPVRAAK